MLDAVKKYLARKGQRIEEIGDHVLVCYSNSGTEAILVTLPASPGGVIEAVWEASSEARSLSFDRVYIAVPASFLSRVAGKRMIMLRDILEGYHRVGLLKVTDEGEVEVVIAAPDRRSEALEPKAPAPERASQGQIPVPRASSQVAASGQQLTPTSREQIREPEFPPLQQPRGQEAMENLPAFVQDNPWVAVLSRRRAESR